MKSIAMTTATTFVTLAVLSTIHNSCNAFVAPQTTSAVRQTALDMAKGGSSGGKGFGATPPPPPPKKKKVEASAPAPVLQKDDTMITGSDDNDYNPFDKSMQTVQTQDLSRGKAALDEMRRKKAEERNAELTKMQQLQEVDQMMRETGGEAAVIPEKVAQRMGKRMLPFVGIPLLGGMGAFVGFWYMATYRDMEFQPVLVAGTTIALLAIGLVGITYSMMSASWDADREGTLLGTEEFSRNVGNIKDGLSRSGENAQVREQIMVEENRARQTQANKKKPKKPAATSLAEKMGDELK